MKDWAVKVQLRDNKLTRIDALRIEDGDDVFQYIEDPKWNQGVMVERALKKMIMRSGLDFDWPNCGDGFLSFKEPAPL